MPWVDIVVIAILAIAGIVGCVKGFLKTLIGFFGTIITLVIAVWLAKYVSVLLENWFGLTTALTNWVMPTVAGECSDGVISGVMLIFAQILMGKTSYNINDPETVQSEEFINAFASSIGNIISTVITVIVLFILIKIALLILNKVFEKISKSKVLGDLDKLLGFVLGVVKGAFSIFMIFGIVYLLTPVITPLGDLVTNLTAQNPVSNQLYAWACDLLDKVIIPWFNR